MGEPRDLLGFVLPRTVVGLALWLLIFALGAGASGVVFFVAYERRLTQLDNRINSVRTELEQRLSDAVTQLQQADKANQVTATGAAGPAGDANRLIATVGPSVGVVEGADATGARTSGSGFVLSSTANQSWLLTSYHLVAGSVAAAQGVTLTVPGGALPAPSTVTVHLGGVDRLSTVYSWDPSNDLALIIVEVGSVPALKFSSAVPAQGLPVWAIGASGGPLGTTAARGQLVTSTAQNLATNAVFGPRSSGGPLVDVEGKVLGVLTTFLAPPAPPTATVGVAIPVRQACTHIVVCPRS